jgi:serine phosphatase RsbU (regulator of sigma subunit)
MTVVEEQRDDGVRMYLPQMGGGNEAGVLALTLDAVDEDGRRLLRQLAVLAGGMLAAKNAYTDEFLQARRGAPMSLSAEVQWALLPPMTMITPQVALAGILEPAYDVAGDSFDYAINGNVLHLAVIDAMGHGLNAAMLATLAIGAYRHARRAGVGLADLYGLMDAVIEQQFGAEQFVTAQLMRLDTEQGGQQFGMERLIDFVERAGQVGEGVQETVRGLSRALASARGGVTTDDTTLFLVEWRGGSAG